MTYDHVAVEVSRAYHRNQIHMTVSGAPVVLKPGTPISKTGVATSKDDCIGFSLHDGTIQVGSTVLVSFHDVNRLYLLVYNGRRLPDEFWTVTGLSKAALDDVGKNGTLTWNGLAIDA